MKYKLLAPSGLGFVATAFAALGILLPGIGRSQTLEHAVRLMLYNEPEIQAANFDRLSAIEDWKITRGDLRPQVTLEGTAGYLQRDRTTDGLVQSTGDGLFSRQIGISVRQLLYDGGLARHQALSAKEGYRAQELVERSMLESRVVDLCEVYFEVIRAQEQVRLAQEQVNRHKDMRDMIKAKAAADGNRADLALVDGRLSLAVNAMESQQLAYENALIRFVRLTGQPASGLKRPTTPKVPGSKQQLDLTKNWDYLASHAVLEAANHKYESVTGTKRPKIYIDAGASMGEDVLGIEGEDDEVHAMITMSWDLYNGGSNRALRQREHWQVRKAEVLVRAAYEESEYQAALLWKEREGSIASVKSLGAYVQRLEGVLADYEEQFKVGRQQLLNILDVQGELYTARTKLLDAKFNVETTAYRILGVQGSLTSMLISEQFVQEYLDRNPDKDEAPSDLRPVNALPAQASNATPVAEMSRKEFLQTNPAPSTTKKRKPLLPNPFAKPPESGR